MPCHHVTAVESPAGHSIIRPFTRGLGSLTNVSNVVYSPLFQNCKTQKYSKPIRDLILLACQLLKNLVRCCQGPPPPPPPVF